MFSFFKSFFFITLLKNTQSDIIIDKAQKQKVLACLGVARARVQQDYEFILSLFEIYKLEKANPITAKKIIMNYGLVYCYDNINEEQTTSLMRLITTHHQIDSLSNENKYLLSLELVKRHKIPDDFKKKMSFINQILEEIKQDAYKEKAQLHSEKENELVNTNNQYSLISMFHLDGYYLMFIIMILLFLILKLLPKKNKEHKK